MESLSRVENQIALTGLRRLVPLSQIFFGTDFPFGNAVDRIKSLEASEDSINRNLAQFIARMPSGFFRA
jgi:hypothetical protein